MTSDYDKRKQAQLEASLPAYCAPAEPSYRDPPPLIDHAARAQCVCWGCLHWTGDCVLRNGSRQWHEDDGDESLNPPAGERQEKEITVGSLIDRSGGGE